MEQDKETSMDFSAGFLFKTTAHIKHTLWLPWITNTVHVYFFKCKQILLHCADLTNECTLRLQILGGDTETLFATADGTPKEFFLLNEERCPLKTKMNVAVENTLFIHTQAHIKVNPIANIKANREI